MLTLRSLAAVFLFAVVLGGCAGDDSSDDPKPKKHARDSASVLYAQSATTGTLAPGDADEMELTLRGVGRQTTWFQDRPGRDAGQYPTGAFVGAWKQFGFTKDAPNAALSVLDAEDEHDTLVVELVEQPRYDAAHDVLRYKVRVLDDADGAVRGIKGDPSIPRSFKDASLFIDDTDFAVTVVSSSTNNVTDAGSIDMALDPHFSFRPDGTICEINRCAQRN